MLIHIVCWKYNSAVDEETRTRHVESLRSLAGVIDVIQRLDVGRDILHLERSFDTGLVAHFADEAALEAYTVHPEHQKAATLGREISQQVVSVDYLVPEGEQ